MKKKPQKNKAVSEILGTILLLGMSVMMFSSVYVAIFIISPAPSKPSVNIAFRIENDNIIIDHFGGKALSLETKILIKTENESMNTTINNIIENKYKNDNVWNIGEQLTYSIENLSRKTVTINIIDIDSNSIVATGKLQRS